MAADPRCSIKAKEQAEENQNASPLPQAIQAGCAEQRCQQVHRELTAQGPAGTVNDFRKWLMREHQRHVGADNIGRQQKEVHEGFHDLEVMPIQRNAVCAEWSGDKSAKKHREEKPWVDSQDALCQVGAEAGRTHPACGHEKAADDEKEVYAAAAGETGEAFTKIGLPPTHSKKQGERVIKQHQGGEQEPQEVKVVQAVIRAEGLLHG